MDARKHSSSPQPSPHGAIGEPTGGSGASGHGSSASVGSGSGSGPGSGSGSGAGSGSGSGSSGSGSGLSGTAGVLPPTHVQSHHHHTHSRSASFATRPRTPAMPTSNSSVNPGDDELDLSALMAHGQRQLDLDRSRFGRFGIPPAPVSAGPTVGSHPIGAAVGLGSVGSVGAGLGGTAIGGIGGIGSAVGTRADSPSRWPVDDEWRGSSRVRDSSMRRGGSTNSVQTAPPPPPLSTNLSTNLFIDSSFPSPIGRPRPSPLTADPAAQAMHHLNALTSILNPLMAQNDEVIRLRAEVELWRGEWQRCDRERRRLDAMVTARNDEPVDGQPFSAVLLDGDGLIFQDEYLRKGFAGGQQAARALVSALPGLATRILSGDDKDTPTRDLGQVVVQVFVNRHGLGNALLKAGSVPSWTMYDSFWQGFSGAHDLFSVVDAGHVKEAADAKIREHLKLYANHRQCGTIFLGASHDNSYATVLSSLETTSGLNKLVLLKGYSDLAPQLRSWASRVAGLPDLFRSTRIEKPSQAAANGSAAAPNVNGQGGATSTASTMNANSNATATAKTKEKDNGRAADPTKSPERRLRSIPSAPAPAPAPAPAAAKDWTADVDDDEVDSESLPSTPEAADDVEIIEWDGATDTRPRRPRTRGARAADDDEADDKRKAAVGKKFGKTAARSATVTTVRNLKPRPCHTYYLSPWGCKNREGCEYAHHYKLTDDQTDELARLAKEIICPYVRSKRCHFSEDECVYGHRCPRGERCTFGDTCRFKDLPNGHGEESRA